MHPPARDRKEGTGIVKRSYFSCGFLALAALVCLTLTAGARADLVITGGTGTAATNGGTGVVDFTISSTTGTDALSSFNVQLQISVLSGGSFLQFTPTQPNPTSSSNYVFAGNSFGANNSLPFWGPPTLTVTPNDTISGGDKTANSASVTIPTSPGSLLMEVQFQAAAGSAVGDSFAISLVPSSGLGNSQTFFDNQNTALNFTSTAAVVTLSAPAASPEPSSLVLTGLASLGFMFYRRTSRRTKPAQSTSEFVETPQD
jgi:hypothetical protein